MNDKEKEYMEKIAKNARKVLEIIRRNKNKDSKEKDEERRNG